MDTNQHIGLILPTRNAGSDLVRLLHGLEQQTLQPDRRLLIDTASTDGTPELAAKHDFQVIHITKAQFGHGRTRQQAFEILQDDIDILICLTQDVDLHETQALEKLVEAFADEKVGAAYGRQLPHLRASLAASLIREFNYPSESVTRTLADKELYGIKTIALSDTFAAYRKVALQAVGGFPVHVTTCEDVYVGAKMLINGWHLRYAADAVVRHSHELDFSDLWKRYCAIGHFYACESWIKVTFGRNEREGIKLLKYIFHESCKRGGIMISMRLICDMFFKYLAYLWGKMKLGNC